jgi:hypothetical protein
MTPEAEIPAADILRLVLVDADLGESTGSSWPIYVSFLPGDAPDDSIVVYDTAGVLDGRSMRTGDKFTHPGVQALIRSAKYGNGFHKARRIAGAMDRVKRARVVISSGAFAGTYTVDNISRTGDVLPVGVEEEGDRRRHRFTVNAILTVTKND